LKKELSVLPFKPRFNNSFWRFIVCKSGSMMMKFQIFEQITVTRSQIWTVWQCGSVEEIHSREQLAVQQVTCELGAKFGDSIFSHSREI